MTCESRELIVGYLYDELTDSERRSFDAHLSVCDECRGEVAGLKATRSHLSLWAPPEPEFAFRIVREQAPDAKVLPMRSRWKPALGLAASRAEARRLIAQGGVRLDGKTVGAEEVPATEAAGALLQVGKRRFVRLR